MRCKWIVPNHHLRSIGGRAIEAENAQHIAPIAILKISGSIPHLCAPVEMVRL